ncbi:MAG TPA: hypothetical protein VHI71_01940 [Actinomycetota bacterium]|nr:hypothetical protein [Actinomycetota bacterium]
MRFRPLMVAALAAASLGISAPPASACQSDSPCPCSEPPTSTVNQTWDGLTGKGDLILCTY